MNRAIFLSALLFSAACRDEEPYGGSFDLPVAAAVLDPSRGGPFEEPVGFVANGHGGQIVQLALKQGRFLTDDQTASFLRSNFLSAGGARALSSVEVYAPDRFDVRVFAGDRAYEQLVEIPYIVGEDNGIPLEARVTVEEPVFFDADGSGNNPEMVNIEIKKGYTTEEIFTAEFDGTVWQVTGSRSGRQLNMVGEGEPFVGDERRIAFTINGAATAGDYFEIVTHSGLREFDVGGIPQALAMAPDQSAMAVIVTDPTTLEATLKWFDPAARTLIGDVALTGQPVSLSFGEDGNLYVADAEMFGFWEVAPGALDATAHTTPWPTHDVAMLQGESRLAYVVSSAGTELWTLDLETGEFRDTNTMVPGTQGHSFLAPITGIAAMPVPGLLPEYDPNGVRLTGRSVAISLGSGRVQFLHEDGSCLVQDAIGPATEVEGSYGSNRDYGLNFRSVELGAYLEVQGSSTRHVSVNPCAGVAVAETWKLRYDQIFGAWQVQGTVSGPQEELAYEDERFFSDNGSISFVVRSGAVPSQDGWEFTFTVDSGRATADGDNDGDGTRDVELGVPGDPVPFSYRVGSRNGGWAEVDERPFVLVLGETANTVGRVDPQEADVDVGWD